MRFLFGNTTFNILYTLIGTCLGFGAFAQTPAPTDLCVTVNPVGVIVLSWNPSPGADPGLTYSIARDTGSGFQETANVGPSTLATYSDPTALLGNINTYRISAVLNGVNSAPTSEVSNMALALNTSDQSVAQLSWNIPVAAPSASSSFTVLRKVDGASFLPLVTLSGNVAEYKDTLYGFCRDTVIAYEILFDDAMCNMVSNVRENDFKDDQPPPQPVIETATVDINTNDILLFWGAVNVPDLNFYRVQDIDVANQQFVNVGTIDALDPPEFVYPNAGAGASRTLGVIAFDDCNNDQAVGLSATTMFAEASYNSCDLEAMVSWNGYMGWAEGVAEYNIRAVIDGSQDVSMGTVDASATFFMAPIMPNKEYCFYVKAESNGNQRPSTSNLACLTTDYPVISAINYLASVDVVADNTIEVKLLQDQQAEGTTFKLFRARDGGSFKLLGTFDQTTDAFLTYTDQDVETNDLVYSYQWEAYDGCGAFIAKSNISQNMVLNVLADSREWSNFLGWNAYVGWDGDVMEYEIWRRTGSETELTPFAQISANELKFTENVEPYRMEEGEFCYKIVARETANAFGGGATVSSNIDCGTQEPVVWIPSAMVIDGEADNRIFKPVASFIDFDSFKMEIISKWGEKLFISNSIDDGWDGTYKGNVVHEDYYKYIIFYRDGSGKSYIRKGSVFVLRQQTQQ